MAFVALIVLGYRRGWPWTGLPETRRVREDDEEVVPGKTLWDWLELLLIPLVLAALAFLLNSAQTERDQRHEDDAAREETLRAYLAQMSDLMLDRRILRSKEGADVRTVARTTTLTAVRRLDGERRGVVVRFLAEAGLLGPRVDIRNPYKIPRIEDELAKLDLAQADLRGAKLRGAALPYLHLELTNLQSADLQDAELPRARLVFANLRGARLRGAVLMAADLRQVDLQGADLRDAVLYRAYLNGAKISNADLRDAKVGEGHLREADLRGADLRGADLHGADLRHADLREADLREANLRDADLRDAKLRDARGAKRHSARLR